jgi:alpha-glucoside transport system substrate-binding protein
MTTTAAAPAAPNVAPGTTTRRDLLRLRSALLALTAAVLVGSVAVFTGVRSTVLKAGADTAPAVLDVLAARSALVQADAAAMNSFRTGQARLIGPGEEYQSQLALASQSLTQVAEHNTAGEPASRTLQLVEGLVVAYSGLIGRADAHFRQDEQNPLWIADLWDASRLLSTPGSGILAQLDSLAQQERDMFSHQLSSGWLSTSAMLLWITPSAAMLGVLLSAQWYLRRRFRRAVNPALVAATVALLLVMAGTATVLVAQSRAETAATTLDQTSQEWRAQGDAVMVDGQHALAEVLRGRCGDVNLAGCGDSVNSFLKQRTAVSGASPGIAELDPADAKKVDEELTAAVMSGVLGYLIPLGATAIAVIRVPIDMTASHRFRPTRRLAVALLAAGQLAAGGCSAVGSESALTVIASWTGDEEIAFRQVLQGFTDETGIKVSYTGTRALSQVLVADVQKGQPPDVAVLPSPGELAKAVRGGDVHPVERLLGDRPEESYSELWLGLQGAGADKLYAVPVKTNLKSIVWYDPEQVTTPPGTWAELTALTDGMRARGQVPWCMGMSAPPVSGWPGTDWIEDIVLHQAGPDVYRRWAAGTEPWTAPGIRQAWSTWGEMVTAPGSVHGGPTAALLTDFGDAGKPMFADSPGCALEHQASFIMAGYRNTEPGAGSVPGEDFDFFPFPASGERPGSAARYVVSADLAAMFRPSKEGERLMTYLAGERAQSVWPKRGNAFSANKKVLAENVYTDDVSKRIARTLTTAATLCFDASDVMPTTMRTAFNHAVLAYLADPAQLDAILRNLEQVRAGIRADERLDVPCGQ